MNKICVIAAYIGKLPNYFPLLVKSCEYNKSVDFFLFTDSKINFKLPSNFYLFNTSLSNIKVLAETKLNCKICLEKPYKLCDLRPFYGIIFNDYIKEYEYWGHYDLDLIFGNLQYFLKKYELCNYERFNALGHLSLYKNTPCVNNYYKLEGASNNYIEVLSNKNNFAFDEIMGMTNIFIKNNKPIFTKMVYADIASIYDRYRMIQTYRFDKNIKNYKYQIFYWENGHCYRAFYYKRKLYKEELMYIHFKKRPDFNINFQLTDLKAFYITKFGFFPKNNEVSLEIIKKYNPYKGKIFELSELGVFKLKNLSKKAKKIFSFSKEKK